MSIDNSIVNVVVSDETGAINQADLKTILIFGLDKVITEQVGYNISDFTGILPSDTVYKSLVKVFAQKPGQKVIIKGILASAVGEIQPALNSIANKFFFISTYGATSVYAKEISDWATANYKMYFCSIQDLTAENAPGISNELNSESTAVLASPGSEDVGAGAVGWLAPLGAGSGTFSFKPLKTYNKSSAYTPTQEATLKNGNVIFMTNTYGEFIVSKGFSSSGHLLNLTWQKYWLINRITEELTRCRIFHDKIEYSVDGVAILKDAITKVMIQARNQGILNKKPEKLDEMYNPITLSPFIIIPPNLAEATQQMKSEGILPPFKVTAYLSVDVESPIQINLTTTL